MRWDDQGVHWSVDGCRDGWCRYMNGWRRLDGWHRWMEGAHLSEDHMFAGGQKKRSKLHQKGKLSSFIADITAQKWWLFERIPCMQLSISLASCPLHASSFSKNTKSTLLKCHGKIWNLYAGNLAAWLCVICDSIALSGPAALHVHRLLYTTQRATAQHHCRHRHKIHQYKHITTVSTVHITKYTITNYTNKYQVSVNTERGTPRWQPYYFQLCTLCLHTEPHRMSLGHRISVWHRKSVTVEMSRFSQLTLHIFTTITFIFIRRVGQWMVW